MIQLLLAFSLGIVVGFFIARNTRSPFPQEREPCRVTNNVCALDAESVNAAVARAVDVDGEMVPKLSKALGLQ
jgi:hypothetical protein